MPKFDNNKNKSLPPVVKAISIRCKQTNPRSLIYGDACTAAQHELRVSQLFRSAMDRTMTHPNSHPRPILIHALDPASGNGSITFKVPKTTESDEKSRKVRSVSQK